MCRLQVPGKSISYGGSENHFFALAGAFFATAFALAGAFFAAAAFALAGAFFAVAAFALAGAFFTAAFFTTFFTVAMRISLLALEIFDPTSPGSGPTALPSCV